jgi:predicted N-acetyltransferase YhbS
VTLLPISTAAYVRDVLPETHELWGGNRDFARYAADFRADAKFAWHRPFTVGLESDGRFVASCKLYDRELRWKDKRLQGVGIGAVFTSPEFRGRGYASALLAMVLDSERAAGRDFAFLYSDIHPAFYARLGFVALPSRRLTLRVASLDGSRSGAVPIAARDWTGVRRAFERLDAPRPWAFTRNARVWRWLRGHWTAPPARGEQRVNLAVRRKGGVIAYVAGLRIPRQDLLFVEEFGFMGDDGRARISAVLRSAAGDLARVRMWMPPPGAREALPRGSPSVRKTAIFMVAPMSVAARAWWQANKTDVLSARSDPTWVGDHV